MSLKSGRVSHYLHDVTFLCQDVLLRIPSVVRTAQTTILRVCVCVCVWVLLRCCSKPLICDLSDGLNLSARSCGKKRTAKQLICSSDPQILLTIPRCQTSVPVDQVRQKFCVCLCAHVCVYTDSRGERRAAILKIFSVRCLALSLVFDLECRAGFLRH